jgi:hypothetical protein
VALLTAIAAVGATIGSASAGTGGTPTVSVSPTTATPGTTITISGDSYPAGTAVVAWWDSGKAGTASANGRGSFKLRYKVPLGTAAGVHRISSSNSVGTILAVTGMTVNPSPTPSATSTPAPTATPTAPVASPAPSATATPTPTPSASATPTPKPSATATPTPSATPTPTPTPTPVPASGSYAFGTLLTGASNASQEAAAGISVVELELGWDSYEPSDGVFSSTYASDARQRLAAMRSAGQKVVLGIGLQYPPAWVFNYPNSRYVDQFGNNAGNIANLTWNATLRQKVEQYVARVNADLGLNNFWAIRIGSGGLIETLYPGEGGRNAFWAYDAGAQASTPYGGWKPGQTSWNGSSFSTSQVGAWYDWYVSSLTDGVNWQLGVFRRSGYTGFLQVLMPGQGVRPVDSAKAIAGYLGGSGDGNQTVGRGAAWDRVIAKIADRTNVVAYVSSMADGSGNNDLCQSGDASVSTNSTTVTQWSATRWISYLANQAGLAKNGENPGRSDTNTYGATMMNVTAAQMKSCGFQGMMWAHDSNLYDGVSGVTLDTYASLIRSTP